MLQFVIEMQGQDPETGAEIDETHVIEADVPEVEKMLRLNAKSHTDEWRAELTVYVTHIRVKGMKSRFERVMG
jgi:hypothetical protein